MANDISYQTILDGPRHQVVKIVGTLDTSDITYFVPPALNPVNWNFNSINGYPKLNFITFAVEDGLAVNLFWDAATPVPIESLMGRNRVDARKYSGLPNNGGAGVTGGVGLSTQGWAAGQILSFTLELEFLK
jgi:hypothetical protein